MVSMPCRLPYTMSVKYRSPIIMSLVAGHLQQMMLTPYTLTQTSDWLIQHCLYTFVEVPGISPVLHDTVEQALPKVLFQAATPACWFLFRMPQYRYPQFLLQQCCLHTCSKALNHSNAAG